MGCNCEKSGQKGILEFDLEDPLSRKSMERALKADTLYFILAEIDDIFRHYERYGLDKDIFRFGQDKEIDLTNDKVRQAVLEFNYSLRRQILEVIDNKGINVEGDF